MEFVSEPTESPGFPARRPATPSLRSLHERVRALNGGKDPQAQTAAAALLLLAGQYLEHNVVKLARFTRLETEFVARCARRLVDNGVWRGGETVALWSGGAEAREAFWADVAVAEGKLCRRLDDEGRPQWAPGGHWWKSFDLVRDPQPESVVVYHSPPPAPAPEPWTDVDDEEEAGEGVDDAGSPEAEDAASFAGAARDDDEATEAADEEADELARFLSEASEDASPDPVADDRPSSRTGSSVDLFPDAVWL